MIGFVFLLCLLFRWGILHRVLLVVGWCSVLHSSGFICVSSHYLVLPRVRSEKVMTTHSSTLAWKIPWREVPGRLQSMGSLRVGHDWATELNWTELCWTFVCLFVCLFSLWWAMLSEMVIPSATGGWMTLGLVFKWFPLCEFYLILPRVSSLV